MVKQLETQTHTKIIYFEVLPETLQLYRPDGQLFGDYLEVQKRLNEVQEQLGNVQKQLDEGWWCIVMIERVWGDGEMGRWGDGGMGSAGEIKNYIT
ncbi:hypothetical protein ACP6PL_06715 [Dapis sp. BLCC M126]|uniref:hypothetical protein n=1 Tax=Dapis sp. BLCC M126 TaxID=3400189 RepID=UPI003CF60842